jgi:hypothetical protein
MSSMSTIHYCYYSYLGVQSEDGRPRSFGHDALIRLPAVLRVYPAVSVHLRQCIVRH